MKFDMNQCRIEASGIIPCRGGGGEGGKTLVQTSGESHGSLRRIQTANPNRMLMPTPLLQSPLRVAARTLFMLDEICDPALRFAPRCQVPALPQAGMLPTHQSDLFFGRGPKADRMSKLSLPP